MNRKTKLIILIILSLSVYFIYNLNKDKEIKILNIGDGLALGINPYGEKEYSYANYYQEYLKAKLNSKFSNPELSIKELLMIIKTNPDIKKELLTTNELLLTVGYNDILYQLSINNEKNIDKISNKITTNYQELITEIRKYYKREIISIGYYIPPNNNYHLNKIIKKFNSYLNNFQEVTYVDTYYTLKDRTKYFPNPNSYYPNFLAHKKISDNIIIKSV